MSEKFKVVEKFISDMAMARWLGDYENWIRLMKKYPPKTHDARVHYLRREVHVTKK